MDYNRAAVFVQVARAGSFTLAARQLRVPTSSVSRSVARLERDLGARLLHRTTRKLVLTDVGAAYYASIRGSYATIDEADTAVREKDGAPRGTVRLTAPPDVSALAVVIAGFTRAYPKIRVELTLASRYVDLVAEGFDLAVRAGRLADSSLVARRIASPPLQVVAAPSYLRRRGTPRTVDDLLAHDWVVNRLASGRAPIRLVGPDGERSVEVTPAIVADSTAFCRGVVEAGAGLALLPRHTVADSLAAGRLVVVLPAWRWEGSPMYVVLPTSELVPARVAALRDYLAEHLGAQLAEAEATPVRAPRRARPTA